MFVSTPTFRSGPVEFDILLSLSRGDRHGYGIIQDIEARGDAAVPDVGTMYRALARLSEQGLIEGAAPREATPTNAASTTASPHSAPGSPEPRRGGSMHSRMPRDSAGCSTRKPT